MTSLWRRQQRLRQLQLPSKIFIWGTLAVLLLSGATFSFFLSMLGERSRSLQRNEVSSSSGQCDFTQGTWVPDPSREALYNESCPDIFKGWNCIRNARENAGAYIKWRWQPHHCQLPRLDPEAFFNQFRGKSIGFVGDSLNRNMYASFVCSLKKAAGKNHKKWRPIGSDKGITFVEYNVTVAYHRTNLLAHYTPWKVSPGDVELQNLGYKEGFRIDIDVPQSSWIEAPKFYDVLVLSTGHWWLAPEKFNPETSPMVFFEHGKPILPPISPEEGLQLTLSHMLKYVEENMSRSGVMFLRTQSPRHFEGGDWKAGGVCHRSGPLNHEEVEYMFASESANNEVHILNKHLASAVDDEFPRFHLLNITSMSLFRADGHPSTSAKKRHEDCMHWCLPGVTDVWNDLLVAEMLRLGR